MQMRVAVFGLGKIGIAISAVLIRAGYSVVGVDIKEELTKKLNEGKIETQEPGVKKTLKEALKKNKFFATINGIEATKKSKVIIIIIPVILDEEKKPDLKPLISCCKTIAKGLKKGDLVITETTLPPGTTKDIVVPLLEKESDLEVEKDFFVAHAPERVYVGRILEDYKKYMKIIGGVGEKSTRKANKFYEKLSPKGIITMNATEAEAAKVFGIVFRNVNIALANELSKICDKLGIDFWKIREAANSIRFFDIHKPGIPSGHCIPVYPHFMIGYEKYGLIKKALEINEHLIPRYLISRAIEGLKKRGKKIKGSNISVLGRSYRKGVKEDRYSGGLILAEKLKSLGAEVTVYDPLYSKKEMEAIGFNGADNLGGAVKDKDCIIIATDWDVFKSIEPASGTVVIDYMNMLG